MKKLLWKACHDRSRMGSSSHRFPIVTILSMSQMQLLTEGEADSSRHCPGAFDRYPERGGYRFDLRVVKRMIKERIRDDKKYNI